MDKIGWDALEVMFYILQYTDYNLITLKHYIMSHHWFYSYIKEGMLRYEHIKNEIYNFQINFKEISELVSNVNML